MLEELGFTPILGSGNTMLGREDGETDALLAQVKSTDGAAISVKRQDLKDLAYHAYRARRKKPVFIADFGEGDCWVLVRPEDLDEVAYQMTRARLEIKNETGNCD